MHGLRGDAAGAAHDAGWEAGTDDTDSFFFGSRPLLLLRFKASQATMSLSMTTSGVCVALQGACKVVKDLTQCKPHFFFFQWEVASTGAGAAALNTLISQVLHIVMMPMIRPDFWRDRFGGSR